MKKALWICAGFISVILIASFTLSGTVTKGLIGKQDFNLWYTTDSAQTFTRTTDEGYTLTLSKLDWIGIDVHHVYAGGTSRTGTIITTAASDVGYSTKRQMFLNPGTWTISSDCNIGDYSDLVWYFAPGAQLSIASGKTVTFPAPSNIIASPTQHIFTGSGTVSFSSGGKVYPEWWGAKGDGSNDDGAAINLATAVLRSNKSVLSLRPGATYKTTISLNFTSIRNASSVIGNGANILGYCTGKVVFDALDSTYFTLRDINIGGDSTSKPSVGLQVGRKQDNQDAPNNYFYAVNTYGYFSSTAVLNEGSEVTRWDKCTFLNDSAYTLYYDAYNAFHVSSDYATVTLTEDSLHSLNDNLFSNCTFHYTNVATPHASIRIQGTTNALHFSTCYGVAYGSVAEIVGSNASLTFDMHCETTPYVTHNVKLLTSLGDVTLANFTMREYYGFYSTFAIDVDSASNSASIIGGNVTVLDSYANLPIFGNTGTIKYNGTVSIGSNTNLQSFSNLSYMSGIISSQSSLTNLVLPADSPVVGYDLSSSGIIISPTLLVMKSSGSPEILIGNDYTNKHGYIYYDGASDRFIIQGGAWGSTTRNIIIQGGGGKVGIGGVTDPKSNLSVGGLTNYANNGAAISGGLSAGDLYRSGGDPDVVCVVH